MTVFHVALFIDAQALEVSPPFVSRDERPSVSDDCHTNSEGGQEREDESEAFLVSCHGLDDKRWVDPSPGAWVLFLTPIDGHTCKGGGVYLEIFTSSVVVLSSSLQVVSVVRASWRSERRLGA